MSPRRFRTILTCLLAVVCLACPLSRAARGQDIITADTLSDEHVSKAIDAIAAEIYNREDPVHHWDPAKWVYRDHGQESQVGGYTALAVLSLLYAGESYQSPKLRKAIAYLADYPMQGTYARAVRAHVWALLPEKFRDNLSDDAQWLLEAFSERGQSWDYDMNPRTTYADNSLRQYAVLGLWEAAKRGFAVEPRFWQMFEDAFVECQLADGGWNYKGAGPTRGSMTAAGLTVLFITQDFLHAKDALEVGRTPKGRQDRAMTLGLQWMDQNFSPLSNPGLDARFYYYLYGVERVGLASGYKFFAGHDWFREASAELIRRLCDWNPVTREMTVYDKVGGETQPVEIQHLAFGLMFLSRGRVPVVINKLQLADLPWNNRPRDVANLTSWIRDFTETDALWQIVNGDTQPEQWLDAPLLYLASHQALPWLGGIDAKALAREARDFLRKRAAGEIPPDNKPPDRPKVPQLDKLKRYLDLGGTLLAVNEGSSDAFAESIEAAGTVMYPQYEWRELPRDHPIFTITPTRGRLPKLRALSNGVRELIIISPADFSRAFQAKDTSRAIDFQIATNIYFYASEMNRARPRLARHVYAPNASASGKREATIVRAVHTGNWKPEPQALHVLEAYLTETRDLSLRLIDRPLEAIDALQDDEPTLVQVSGIDAHEFTDAERKAIRGYVERGGMILFETPGGLGDFTLSAEKMATELFNRPIRPLLRHPLVTGAQSPSAPNLSRITYRPFALERFGSRELAPRLRAMNMNGQPLVLFSREDLSQGLLDQPCWNVLGYDPQSARDLMGNIIEYALAQQTSANQ